MIVLNTDLDNTIIYSYKHDIGSLKRNVERYQGREISFITERTFELLQEVKKKMWIVPTTTRTVEQYQRIDLGVGPFPYVLAANGGILLVDGVSDERWYVQSKELVADSQEEIDRSIRILETEKRRTLDVRYIHELFVFTKCEEPELVVDELKKRLDISRVDVFHNGVKVYVVPKKLNKGMAVTRLREKWKPEYVIAAGDSEFDLSMLLSADKGLVPYGFKKQFQTGIGVIEMNRHSVFSDALLEECLNTVMEPAKQAPRNVHSK